MTHLWMVPMLAVVLLLWWDVGRKTRLAVEARLEARRLYIEQAARYEVMQRLLVEARNNALNAVLLQAEAARTRRRTLEILGHRRPSREWMN